MEIFIDGDFKSGIGNCKYHCSPTCHPAQVGPDWKYGCTHKAWPQNRYGDFVPIVCCNGEIKNCEIELKRFIPIKNGLKRRIANAKKKIEKYENELKELQEFIDDTRKAM